MAFPPKAAPMAPAPAAPVKAKKKKSRPAPPSMPAPMGARLLPMGGMGVFPR